MSAKAPLKVVRIIGRLNVGGPARQACLLHERLRPEFKTVLITGRPDSGEKDMSYLLGSSEGVYSIDSMSRPVRLFSDLRSLVFIYRILRRERPQIVHTHTAKAGTLGRVAAVLARVPVRVHTFHGHVFSGYFGKVKTRAYLGIERFLARFTTRIVTVSEGQARELADVYRVVGKEKIQVIRNGFDWEESPRSSAEVRAELNLKRDQTAVLWMGRMVPIKGIELLAETVKEASGNSELVFIVAGDGPLRSRFEELTRDCGNLRMLGWQQDVSSLVRACDLVLMTSVNEGTPTSLVEAMFAAKPFVATDAGGTSELAVGLQAAEDGIRKAKNGFIVASDAATITRCLGDLANNPGMRESMGQAGQARARQNWTSERLLQEIKHLYYELASGAKSRGQSA
jgi:glycosyltransferase involved in cell wall biosynthesis